jgi:hypothetical protein
VAVTVSTPTGAEVVSQLAVATSAEPPDDTKGAEVHNAEDPTENVTVPEGSVLVVETLASRVMGVPNVADVGTTEAVVVVIVGYVKEEVMFPAPRAPLSPLTVTVPVPDGRATVASVSEADTTVAALLPKSNLAFLSPMPVIFTTPPICSGPTDVTSGHDRPPAIGEPIPVAKS